MSIPFINLQVLHEQLAAEIEPAVQRVMARGWYVLGPEVDAFETAFAAYHGMAHAVSLANGTQALELALRAGGIGAGDEVITVAHTAMPTVTAIEATGATPVLVDIDADTYTIDPAQVEAAITPRTRAIVPVHIYGQPADMDAIMALADKHSLFVLEDCAQAHGARYKGRIVGTIGHMAAFSFYPTKPLAAYGDGGAVITNDAHLAERVKRLRFYGQSERYVHAERGTNSRLDDIQAAILSVKLRHLDAHNAERRALAAHYDAHLNAVTPPIVREGAESVYHLYVVRTDDRETFMADLKAQGINTLIHYPIPIHLQESHADLNTPRGSLPVTERIADQIVSLPMYVGLTLAQVEQVAAAINARKVDA